MMQIQSHIYFYFTSLHFTLDFCLITSLSKVVKSQKKLETSESVKYRTGTSNLAYIESLRSELNIFVEKLVDYFLIC